LHEQNTDDITRALQAVLPDDKPEVGKASRQYQRNEAQTPGTWAIITKQQTRILFLFSQICRMKDENKCRRYDQAAILLIST
jgi:hypothetical protein